MSRRSRLPDPRDSEARALVRLSDAANANYQSAKCLINLEKLDLGAESPLTKEMVVWCHASHPEPSVQALKLADALMCSFAGPHTRKLGEEYRRDFARDISHDTYCLLCFKDGIDEECTTCKRSFHDSCLDAFPRGSQTCFYCPICVKRLWNEGEADMNGEFDSLRMTIARQFLEDSKFAEKINLDDDGTVAKDHEVLLKLKSMEAEQAAVNNTRFSNGDT